MRAKLIDHLFSQPNNELQFCPTRRKKGHKNICVLNEIMRGITLHTIPEAMGKAQWWAFAHGTHDSLLNSQVASNRPYFKDEGWSKMHFLFYWLDGCILNLLARSLSRECRKIICLELVYFFAFFSPTHVYPLLLANALTCSSYPSIFQPWFTVIFFKCWINYHRMEHWELSLHTKCNVSLYGLRMCVLISWLR